MPLIYNLLEKTYVNFTAYAEKKMIWQKKREIAKKLTKKWKIKVKRKGPTFESRLNNQLRQTLSMFTKTTERPNQARAKDIMAYFTMKAVQQMEFRSRAHAFRRSIHLINLKMLSRIETHKVKMEWLEKFFDQEVDFLINYSQLHMKSKRHKRTNALLCQV